MTMVDRVAVAISGAPFPTAASRRKARAAILAMREPTPDMCISAWDADGGPSSMFRAMIDAALSEEKKDG